MQETLTQATAAITKANEILSKLNTNENTVNEIKTLANKTAKATSVDYVITLLEGSDGEGGVIDTSGIDADVLPALWIADYKTYGDNSYVHQITRIRNKVYASELAANDYTLNALAFDYMLKNPSAGSVAKWLSRIDDIGYSTMEGLITWDEVVNNSTAMTALAKSSLALNAFVGNSTAMTAVAGSSTAMTAVINNSQALDKVVSSSTAMTAVAASATALHAICKSSSASAAIANAIQAYRSTVKSTLDAATSLFTKASSTEEYFSSYGLRDNWKINTNTILLPYQTSSVKTAHSGCSAKVYYGNSNKVIHSFTLTGSSPIKFDKGVSFRGIGFEFDTKDTEILLLYSYVYTAK